MSQHPYLLRAWSQHKVGTEPGEQVCLHLEEAAKGMKTTQQLVKRRLKLCQTKGVCSPNYAKAFISLIMLFSCFSIKIYVNNSLGKTKTWPGMLIKGMRVKKHSFVGNLAIFIGFVNHSKLN